MSDDARIDIRNRMALAGWLFMGLWLAMLVLMTWVMLRDGPHPSQPAWVQYAALAVFWIIGAPAAAHLFSLPCTRFRVWPDGHATLTRHSLLAREVETYGPGEVADVEVREGRDEDGDRHWRVMLVARDGRVRLLREGLYPTEQEELADHLRSALLRG